MIERIDCDFEHHHVVLDRDQVQSKTRNHSLLSIQQWTSVPIERFSLFHWQTLTSMMKNHDHLSHVSIVLHDEPLMKRNRRVSSFIPGQRNEIPKKLFICSFPFIDKRIRDGNCSFTRQLQTSLEKSIKHIDLSKTPFSLARACVPLQIFFFLLLSLLRRWRDNHFNEYGFYGHYSNL